MRMMSCGHGAWAAVEADHSPARARVGLSDQSGAVSRGVPGSWGATHDDYAKKFAQVIC